MTKERLLGAHMSIAGGVEQAIYKGASINCTAIQIFTASNRQWSSKEFDSLSVEKFKKAQEETNLTHVISHASYLINLGSESSEIVKKSIVALYQELIRCKQLDIKYLVLHPGAGIKDLQKSIKQIAEGISKVLSNFDGSTMILLETMAGQGTSVGNTFEQLALLRSLVEEKKRIGVCFDTCHAWAAGYDFSSPESYHELWKQFDKIIGLEYLKACHINDSLKPRGSKVDRHADIGKGTMGLSTFELIMNDKNLFYLPKILETPSHELSQYAHNLSILRSLELPSKHK